MCLAFKFEQITKIYSYSEAVIQLYRQFHA